MHPTLISYLGLVRLYSFVDLVLLLMVTDAPTDRFIGALLLWFGFLALVEANHNHPYRVDVPHIVWVVLLCIGGLLYGWQPALLFIAFSALYTIKDQGNWGLLAPIARGLQIFMLIGGLVGYGAPLTLIAGILLAVRNVLGDARHVETDREAGMNTIPILLKQKRNLKKAHLFAVLVTSCVWWYLGSYSILYLFAAIAIEIGSYRLTRR